MKIFATEGRLEEGDAFLTIHCDDDVFTGSAKRHKLTVMLFQAISRQLHNELREQFSSFDMIDAWTFRLSEPDWMMLKLLTEH